MKNKASKHPYEKSKCTNIELNLPVLDSKVQSINDAFRIAIGDVTSNVTLWKDGLLDSPKYALMAGINYKRPWTRDASINTWNGVPLLYPTVAYNTLLSVLKDDPEYGIMIGGQYWDSIIWATAVWNYYLYTGDKEFLKLAYKVTQNTLRCQENREFDESSNLFRGPACFQDGVSAYPEYYKSGPESGILHWPKYHPEKVAKKGYGIPMKTLSTNCLYFNAYKVLTKISKQLSLKPKLEWNNKAENLKQAINKYFWNEKKGLYDFIADSPVNSDYQESIGNAFALIFGIPNTQQAENIFKNIYICNAGIPCIWPSFERYNKDKKSFGRHSGTVWPQVQGFWAECCANFGQIDKFGHELFTLAKNAQRDNQFVEIYHPLNGKSYGGLQEKKPDGKIELWKSTNRQTWSASAYLSMIFKGLVGMNFNTKGIKLRPVIPQGIQEVNLFNVQYRKANLDIFIKGAGNNIKSVKINGKQTEKSFLPIEANGKITIEITVS